MTTHTSQPPAGEGWRMSINYGPEGEANYANVYDDKGQFVGNLRVHHAHRIVEALTTVGDARIAAFEGQIEGLMDDLEAAEDRIEALTSQQPAKVYVAVNHTGCIYECEDEDRVIRAAQSAFETAVARAQQHTEPVAGEVEVVAYRCRHDRPFGGTWQVHQRIYEWDKFDITEPLVRKSSYDALAAAKDATIAELTRERDEALGWAGDWHRQCQTVATILGLPEPDGETHAAAVRDKFDAVGRQRDALREILGDCQRALAMLVEPGQIVGTSLQAAWAICVAAEAKARAALKDEGSAT